MHKVLQQQNLEKQISFLQNGNERGLNFFYERFYGYLFARSFRATQDECAAESITQEALLRLWLYRQQVTDIDTIFSFLKAQVKAAINAFYKKSLNRFHRNLLRLDAIEDYQEFMFGYEIQEEQEMDLIYLEKLEEEKQQRLEKINQLLPNLNQEQQLFIKLCLKYSFNYERIAYYLGGISDYEVSLQVEKTIATLRSVLNCSQKMEILNKPSKIVLQGEFDDQQTKIFHMRYELQLSFDQIAESLKLTPICVKTLFIQAHAKIKSSNKST